MGRITPHGKKPHHLFQTQPPPLSTPALSSPPAAPLLLPIGMARISSPSPHRHGAWPALLAAPLLSLRSPLTRCSRERRRGEGWRQLPARVVAAAAAGARSGRSGRREDQRRRWPAEQRMRRPARRTAAVATAAGPSSGGGVGGRGQRELQRRRREDQRRRELQQREEQWRRRRRPARGGRRVERRRKERRRREQRRRPARGGQRVERRREERRQRERRRRPAWEQQRRWRRPFFFNFSFIFLPSVKMHTAQSLPSARQKALGKAGFAVPLFAESSLPSATLGKPYAECNRAFAECS